MTQLCIKIKIPDLSFDMLIKICLEKLLAESVPLGKYKEMRDVISKSLEEVQQHHSNIPIANASNLPQNNISSALVSSSSSSSSAAAAALKPTVSADNNPLIGTDVKTDVKGSPSLKSSASAPVNMPPPPHLSLDIAAGSSTGSNNAITASATFANVAFYWVPFKLAFQPNTSSKMKEIALDSIQKLVSYHLFTGSSVGFAEFDDPFAPPTPLDEKPSILLSSSNPNNSLNTSSTTIGKLSPTFQAAQDNNNATAAAAVTSAGTLII